MRNETKTETKTKTTHNSGTAAKETTMQTTTHTQAAQAHSAAAALWLAVLAREEEGKPTKAATKAATKASTEAAALSDALVDAGWDEDRTDTQAVRSAEEAAEAHKAAAAEHRAADSSTGRGMAGTLARYKPGYKPCVAYSGAESQNNGDVLAQALEGKSPSEVMDWAERVLGLETGFLATKYASLNPGQQRMNSGNRVRAALKRGDLTEAQLKAVK